MSFSLSSIHIALTILNLTGEGSYGIVFKGYRADNPSVAVALKKIKNKGECFI